MNTQKPQEITEYVTKGEYHKALSLYSESITELQKIGNQQKKLYHLYCERASILLKVKLFEESLMDIKKAINIDEKTPRAYEIQVEILLATSKQDEAEELLKELVEKFKNHESFKKKLENLNDNIIITEDPFCKISTELDCGLCFRIFFDPITTSCGHTFCRECLSRALDYAQKCPLCRSPIHCRPEVHSVTYVINDLIQKYKPEEYLERKKEYEDSKKMTTSNVPFFCLDYILFPSSKLPLHVFEPKYRLMIRRCMEGSRSFGMVPIIDGKLADVGTIAKIESINVLPDGRSIVKTIGQERFKVLDVWELDGYKVGKIEYFDEVKDQVDERDAAQINKLAKTLYSSFSDEVKQSIQEKYGSLPEENELDKLTYWLSSILPISNPSKLDILKKVSTNDRIQKLLDISKDMMTSNSCSIM
eukprot:gene983-9890_t